MGQGFGVSVKIHKRHTLPIKMHSWTDLVPYGSLDHSVMKTDTDTPIKVSSNSTLSHLTHRL